MTVEEKRALNNARVNAVRKAWAEERALVLKGKCTRQWSKKEASELIRNGKVAGYAGHHMKNVDAYPQYAGDSNNIQFLSTKEHINQAHRNQTRVATNGYYNLQTRRMEPFHGRPHKRVFKLNCSVKNEQKRHQASSNAQTAGNRNQKGVSGRVRLSGKADQNRQAGSAALSLKAKEAQKARNKAIVETRRSPSGNEISKQSSKAAEKMKRGLSEQKKQLSKAQQSFQKKADRMKERERAVSRSAQQKTATKSQSKKTGQSRSQ